MPNQPRTPPLTFRCPERLRAAVEAEAAARQATLTDVLVRLLEERYPLVPREPRRPPVRRRRRPETHAENERTLPIVVNS